MVAKIDSNRGRITPESFPPDERVTTGTVARLFQVDISTVWDWCAKGILPAMRIPGRKTHLRILWADAVGLYESSLTSVAVTADAPGRVETKKQREQRGQAARKRMLAR